MVALNSQRQDSTLYSWSCTIIGALWFSSKYKVYKKCLLLLFIPVGHHALKSSLLTLYLAGSEHSKYSCYGLLSLVLFFLRKAKKPIYVKTRKGHFWLTTHFFLVSCKVHLSCLSIRTWFCGLHSSHANPVVLGRRGSLFFFPLMQNHYVIWILFIWKSCLCPVQASHREASLVMKFPYVNPMVMKRMQNWKVASEIFPKHLLKQCRINVDERYLNIIDLNREILETCWLCM